MRSNNSHAKYAQYQVLTAIRGHPGCHIRDLCRICIKEFYGNWSNGKVVKIVYALEHNNKIRSEIAVEGGHTCRKLYPI